MLALILLPSCVIFLLAYRYYGNFLARRCRLDDSRITPAYSEEDGIDFVPTRTSVVFGHHFSSIAGAGPIVGPFLAAAYFGWLPALIWIIVGAIFSIIFKKAAECSDKAVWAALTGKTEVKE